MSEETTRAFLTRLWELQAERGLSGPQLARLLGCDPSYIHRLRAGRRKRLGLPFVLAAVSHFPDLGGFLLPPELPVSNTALPSSNEAAAEEGASGEQA